MHHGHERQAAQGGRKSSGFALILLAFAILIGIVAFESLRWSGGDAESLSPATPADVVFVTSGLTWGDVSESTTPEFACFAKKSGTAGLALSSRSVLTTKRQSLDTLRTGERTLALAPSDGPRPVIVPPFITVGEAKVELVDLSDVSGTGIEREQSLARFDRAFAAVAGSCGEKIAPGSGTRAIVASVGIMNPALSSAARIENTRSYAELPVPLNLQVYADSGFDPALLSSPSTRQRGVVTNVDLAATIANVEQLGTGRAVRGTPVHPGEQIAAARTISLTSRKTEDTYGIVLALSMVALIASAALAKRSGIARAVASVGILSIAVAYTSRIVPIESLGVPATLATLAGYTLAVTALVGTLVYGGALILAPKRPLLAPAIASLLTVAVIAIDAVLGSHASFTSMLGNQPIYAGRFYGFTNHITGIMLACWALGIGMLLESSPAFGDSPHAGLRRAALVLVSGLGLGAIAIAPGMGADAGSALIYAPIAVVAALWVSGARIRPWHIGLALIGGAAVFIGAGLLDASRPASARTHLGALFASLLEKSSPSAALAEFWGVFADRTMRMLEPLWLYSPLIIVPALIAAAALTYVALRKSDFTQAHPHVYRVRALAIAGAWIGAATNDTGLVLVGLAYVVGFALSLAARQLDS